MHLKLYLIGNLPIFSIILQIAKKKKKKIINKRKNTIQIRAKMSKFKKITKRTNKIQFEDEFDENKPAQEPTPQNDQETTKPTARNQNLMSFEPEEKADVVWS